jgi:hypothetical protein
VTQAKINNKNVKIALKMKVEMKPLGIGVCIHLLVCIPLQSKQFSYLKVSYPSFVSIVETVQYFMATQIKFLKILLLLKKVQSGRGFPKSSKLFL